MAELFSQVEQRESDSADWVIRIGVAVLFAVAGSEKFSNDIHSSWMKMFEQIGWGEWFRYFTGVVEVGGAVLVLIQRTATAGLALLACTMAAAAAIHFAVLHDGAVAIFPLVIMMGLVAFTVTRRYA